VVSSRLMGAVSWFGAMLWKEGVLCALELPDDAFRQSWTLQQQNLANQNWDVGESAQASPLCATAAAWPQ
jgi:hypothetical protein